MSFPRRRRRPRAQDDARRNPLVSRLCCGDLAFGTRQPRVGSEAECAAAEWGVVATQTCRILT